MAGVGEGAGQGASGVHSHAHVGINQEGPVLHQPLYYRPLRHHDYMSLKVGCACQARASD